MRSPWPVSFFLAGAVHSAVLFAGGLILIHPPEYGIQGSAASMEIYMVAAMPEESAPEIETAKPEEMSSKPKDAAEPKAKEEIKGDGSSKEPGKSETTLFSQSSAEIHGKDGKYQNVPPQYPALAQEKGWEGTVLVKVRVEREGEPSQVQVQKSSGHKVLDEAAVRAVKKWKFTSGRVGNMEMASWIEIPVRFELKK